MTLPALAIALLVLTATLVVGVVTADVALLDAERDALDRNAAVGVSERLVRADSPVTERANVVNGTALAELDAEDLRAEYGLSPDASVRVVLDDRTILSEGTPSGGVTVERIVLNESTDTRTVEPEFDGSRTVVLPRRTRSLQLAIDPPAGTDLQTVRVNGRVRLHNTSGLNGTYQVPVATASAVNTTQLRFDAVGPLDNESVRIDYTAVETEKRILGVTVDG